MRCAPGWPPRHNVECVPASCTGQTHTGADGFNGGGFSPVTHASMARGKRGMKNEPTGPHPARRSSPLRHNCDAAAVMGPKHRLKRSLRPHAGS